MVKQEQFERVWTRSLGSIAAIAVLLNGFAYTKFALSQPSSITLSPQFSPNPVELKGTAGGGASVSDIIGRAATPTGPCTGFANATPNHAITLKASFNSLNIGIESAQDTALVIRGPGGVWCNDDFQGKNPGVGGQWLAGKYEIWVSSYSKDRSIPYTLRIKAER